MDNEKTYYAVVVLIAAASMLLSPFFYMRSGKRQSKPWQPAQWKLITAVNLATAAALALAYWWWF